MRCEHMNGTVHEGDAGRTRRDFEKCSYMKAKSFSRSHQSDYRRGCSWISCI
ncbi:hypothetical protein Hanom_Chr15g01378581 [Helianthus anomalus]